MGGQPVATGQSSGAHNLRDRPVRHCCNEPQVIPRAAGSRNKRIPQTIRHIQAMQEVRDLVNLLGVREGQQNHDPSAARALENKPVGLEPT